CECADEGRVGARALCDRAPSPELPLDHVGSLADVKVSAAKIGGDRRLPQLRARLAARPGHDVPVLSRADIVSLKLRFAVRSVDQFRAQIAGAAPLLAAHFWVAHLFS